MSARPRRTRSTRCVRPRARSARSEPCAARASRAPALAERGPQMRHHVHARGKAGAAVVGERRLERVELFERTLRLGAGRRHAGEERARVALEPAHLPERRASRRRARIDPRERPRLCQRLELVPLRRRPRREVGEGCEGRAVAFAGDASPGFRREPTDVTKPDSRGERVAVLERAAIPTASRRSAARRRRAAAHPSRAWPRCRSRAGRRSACRPGTRRDGTRADTRTRRRSARTRPRATPGGRRARTR